MADATALRERPHAVLRSGERARRGISGRLPYLPGLDGLRALAVVAVLLYHTDPRWLPGGFLGVEIFFVISGYLITSLLLAEFARRGRINLKRFWLRRARRLLPALYVMLAGVLVFTVLFLPDEVARLRGDVAAALGYVTNWYLVVSRQPYFETVGRPSLLRHLWSLAVEEQFYVLWPLLLSFALPRWRPQRVLYAIIAGIAASALLMAVGYDPTGDPSRVYYGTDTRAAGFLCGAALAFVWVPRRVRTMGPGPGPGAARLLDVAGLGALTVLAVMCGAVDEFDQLLYRGGFLLIAVCAAVAIVAATAPTSRIRRSLSAPPLRWVGLRSYSLYLWHWPVLMVTRPHSDVPVDGLALLAVRLSVTFALAELSYRLVELPIRNGALGRWREALRVVRSPAQRRRSTALRWAAVTALGSVLCLALGVAVVTAQPPPPPSYLAVEQAHVVAAPALTATPVPAPQATVPAPQATVPAPQVATPAPQPTTPEPTPAPIGHVFAVGDSVMLGAARQLAQAIGDCEVDAAVSRQVRAATDILRRQRDAGTLGSVVIVHIGNNGPLHAAQFDELMQVLSGVTRVVVVNLKVPRAWEAPNNEVLRSAALRHPNMVLVDWYAASSARPDWLYRDGIHLRPAGAKAYTALIVTHLR